LFLRFLGKFLAAKTEFILGGDWIRKIRESRHLYFLGIMKNFDRQVADQQTQWRKSHITTKRFGAQNGGVHPWILPRENRWENFFPEIRGPLRAYLQENRVQAHTGIHNLKSSWALGANLYFAVRVIPGGLVLMAGFLQHVLGLEVLEVEAVDFEYEALEPDLKPSALLGERDGWRGYGQTSPDIAFTVGLLDGARGLVLVENKFVETSFYRCSARARNDRQDPFREGNPDPNRCLDARNLAGRAVALCHLETGEGWGRKYWSLLSGAIDPEIMRQLKSCPAAFGGYQLFRQQALAEGIAEAGEFSEVFSCVAFDERNEKLVNSLAGTGLDNWRTGWGGLFARGKARFGSFTHQAWVAWVRQNAGERWASWLAYVSERYGY